MATTAPPLRTKGLRVPVIQALAGSFRYSPGERFRIPPEAWAVVDVLEAKGFISREGDVGVRFLTVKGAGMRSMVLDVAARYRAGNSALSIAQVYGVNEKTVARWLRAMDVEVRTKGALNGQQRKAIARRFVQQGTCQSVLAADYGVNVKTIVKALRDEGVPPRAKAAARTPIAQ